MKTIYALGAAILALSTASALAQTYAPPAPANGFPPQTGYPAQPYGAPGSAPAPGYAPQQGYPAASYPPAQGYASPAYPAPAPVSYCQPYTDKFTMGSEVRVVHGSACMHPDGSWELHPTDSGLRYVTRGGGLYLIPSQPFAVIVTDGHHHHHHDHY